MVTRGQSSRHTATQAGPGVDIAAAKGRTKGLVQEDVTLKAAKTSATATQKDAASSRAGDTSGSKAIDATCKVHEEDDWKRTKLQYEERFLYMEIKLRESWQQQEDLQAALVIAEQKATEALAVAAAAKEEARKATEAAAIVDKAAKETAVAAAAEQAAWTSLQAEMKTKLDDLRAQLQSTNKLVDQQGKQMREMTVTENNRSEAYIVSGQFLSFQQQTQEQLETLKGEVRRAEAQLKSLHKAKEHAEAATAKRMQEEEVAKARTKLFISVPAAQGNIAGVIKVMEQIAAKVAKKGDHMTVPTANNITLLKPQRPSAKAVSCIVQLASAKEVLNCLRVKRSLNEADKVPAVAADGGKGKADAAGTSTAGRQQHPQQEEKRGIIFIDECLTKAEKAQRDSQEELRQELKRQGVAVSWRRGRLVKAVQNVNSGAWHWVDAAVSTTASTAAAKVGVQKVWVRKGI